MNVINMADELIFVGQQLGIDINYLNEDDARNLIQNIFELYKPFKKSGHLGIGHDCIELDLKKWEFSYMEYLCSESGYIFFEQSSARSQKVVLKIEDVRMLGKILEKASGIEYFLTNGKQEYLIAVNWYAIEIAGDKKRFPYNVSVS